MILKVSMVCPNFLGIDNKIGILVYTLLLVSNHYQKCGHRIVCSIRVFKMDFHVIKLSIVAYP